MRYFLAFVLLGTFIAKRKLLRMLDDETKNNKNLIDSILAEEEAEMNPEQNTDNERG